MYQNISKWLDRTSRAVSTTLGEFHYYLPVAKRMQSLGGFVYPYVPHHQNNCDDPNGGHCGYRIWHSFKCHYLSTDTKESNDQVVDKEAEGGHCSLIGQNAPCPVHLWFYSNGCFGFCKSVGIFPSTRHRMWRVSKEVQEVMPRRTKLGRLEQRWD